MGGSRLNGLFTDYLTIMKKVMNCIAVDDDRLSLKVLEGLIAKTDMLNLLETFSSATDVANAIRKEDIDLIFLDVEMPDMTGLELIKILDKKPQIIIVSSKSKYALDSYNYDVADYLLKPVKNYARFLQAVQKAYKNFEKETAKEADDYVFIKVDSLLLNFNYNDIFWVEAYGDYVKIHTSQKVYTVYSTLKMIEEKLPKDDFFRVHRSYIVRIDKIKNVDQSNLQIENKIIPISKSYRHSFFERINTL